MGEKLRSFGLTIFAWATWPGLLALCLAATAYGFQLGHPALAFNLIYFSLAVTLLLLERWRPHEVEWSRPDGQLRVDIFHTLVSKGTVQSLFVFSAAIGLAAYITPVSTPTANIWPRDWPLWGQVLLGIAVAEFAFYWAHRLGHEWPRLWHFHAIHHSVTKLWVVNTGRFHFVDSLKSIIPGTVLLVALGAPMEVLTWLSATTAYIGIMTHCNIELRFGWLSYLFNTPALHRWHHSRDLAEGNKNYGENIMLWDWVFGTWFDAKRRPPTDIGISETMPPRFRDQLAWPFQKSFGRSAAEDQTQQGVA